MKRAALVLLLAATGCVVVGLGIGQRITAPYDPALDEVERKVARIRREDSVLYAGAKRLRRTVNLAGVQ